MRAVVALGANMEDPELCIEIALQLLANSTQLLTQSSLYRTKPVGGPPQPDYVNAVCIIESELPPLELLRLLQGIEKSMGRVRTLKWGPRIIDCDLITYGDCVMTSENLTLPHPRAHEREFVLEPWVAIDAEAFIPGKGRVADLLAQLHSHIAPLSPVPERTGADEGN